MARQKARYGVVTMCIGGGQGAGGLVRTRQLKLRLLAIGAWACANYILHWTSCGITFDGRGRVAMGILFLVRQCAELRSLSRTTDKLSALGEAQACHPRGSIGLDAKSFLTASAPGPCVRQKDTLRLVSNAYSKASLKFPTPWCCRSSISIRRSRARTQPTWIDGKRSEHPSSPRRV